MTVSNSGQVEGSQVGPSKNSNQKLGKSSMQNVGQFSIMHINIQGLNHKFLQFTVLVAETSPDVLCLTEHWFMNDDITLFCLPGYKLAAHFSRSEFNRGGCAIFMKENINALNVSVNFACIEKQCEFSICEASFEDVKLVCICLYRSPMGDRNVFFSGVADLLEDVYGPDKYFVIAGDFNVHFERADKDCSELCQLLSCYGLVGHINGITRPSSGSQLDNIFSNVNSDEVKGSIHVTNISDHYGQIVYINTFKNRQNITYIKKRHFTDVNVNTFKNYLKLESWSDVYNTHGASEGFKVFHSILLYYFDISFPLKMSKQTVKKSWVTQEIREYSAYIKDLYVNYQITQNPAALDHYKQERRQYKRFLSNYQKIINHSRIQNSKNKTRTLWNIFNTETNRKKSNLSVIKNDRGDIIEHTKVIADMFLKQFTLKASSADRSLPRNTGKYPSIFLFPVDAAEIFRIIMNFTGKFSAGLDEIPTFVLRHVAEHVSEPLARVINACFIEGVFPDELKKAKIVPVPKKGDYSKICNYRPVSLLPSVSKVFERAIYNRLVDFLNRNNILAEEQFGFRSGKSTELAIFNVLSFIYEKLDNGKKVAGLYFDLSRAFDTVNHQVMEKILANCGIRGIVQQLIMSYLTRRKQIVCIDKNGSRVFSEWGGILQGVPQGSILGPVLFLLYVNGLASVLMQGVGVSSGRICQFADDTSQVLEASSVAGLSLVCSRAAKLMSDWCSNHYLELNVKKTGVITFNKKLGVGESLYVKLNSRSIPVAEHIKFLGVILDANLSWECHIRSLKSKLASNCALIRRLREIVSIESFRIFYFSNIQSVISYGIVFWGSSPFAMEVFKTQKRIIRCMLKLAPRSSCKPHFPALGILTVPSLYYFHLVMFVKKHRHLFHANSDYYADSMNIITRARDDLCIPVHSSTFYKRGPYYRAIKAFRALPDNLKSIENDRVFKGAVSSYLIQKCYYEFIS